MAEQWRGHNVGKLILGLTVIAFGVIFLLGNFNVIESGNYLRYWPVIFIALGLAKLLGPRGAGGRMFGFIVAVVGVLLLLKEFGKIAWNIWDLWPLILVLLGLSIIWGAFGHRSRRERFLRRHDLTASCCGGTAQKVDPDSYLDISSVFGGNERLVTSQDFRGGRISTIMGGSEIDFRQASMAAGAEAVIDISVVFGGVEIRVPEDWKVVVRVSAFLGGIDDRTRKPVGDDARKLILAGNIVFGGLEVRN